MLYFAGRPVAILEQGDALSSLTFLSTDHLGTPVLATDESGVVAWQGGFEPFGADWNGAVAAGVFLRFPGQWVDASWAGKGLESGFHYNVHRWYLPGPGRYTSPDPIGLQGGINLYLYAGSNPAKNIDPLGLRTFGIGGKVCTDCSCRGREASLPLFIKSEAGQALISIAPGGQCIEADGVYGPNGIVKLTDLAKCWIECNQMGTHGGVRCNMTPPWPVFFPCTAGNQPKPGPDWPNNPFCS